MPRAAPESPLRICSWFLALLDETRLQKSNGMLDVFSAKLAVLAAIVVGIILAGCGDDSSPIAPDSVMDLWTTVTVTSVEVIKDGDGIEGQGEFYFYRQVGGTGIGWTANLSSGESDPVNWTKRMHQVDYKGEGYSFSIEFRCTEYDRNILGNVYPDSDMDDRHATANYVMSPDLNETNYITLGNDKCKVLLHYAIASSLVAEE